MIVFVVAEYYRTFGVKLAYGEKINDNPVVYGLQRLIMYFSTSVNSGGTEFGFFKEGSLRNALFSMTFSPAATVLYSFLGMQPIGQSVGSISTVDVAVSMGLFNPEFNNRWGVVTPFTEGWIAGALFWIVWGFIGTHFYLKVTKQRAEPWNLIFYGLFVAAFVDNQTRVALLAAPHFLLPFLWLLAMWAGSKIIGATLAVPFLRVPVAIRNVVRGGQLRTPSAKQ